MELVKVLQDAMDRIADPIKWTQGAAARDTSGQELNSGWDPKATTWCSVGSIRRSTMQRHLLFSQSIFLLNDVARSMHFEGGIADLNDNGTHEDVMLMFKQAIEQAESASGF